MPDFNKFSPDVPFTPSAFSQISIQDAFTSLPDFPKLSDLPDIGNINYSNPIGSVLGPNPFNKYKSFITGAPAAADDYWENRRFTSDASSHGAFEDVGFLIGADNEDAFARYGKGFFNTVFDSAIKFLDKVGTGSVSTLGTLGGLVGVGNQYYKYDTGNKLRNWLAGASDNGLVTWADENAAKVDELYRPSYQEKEDREKGFFSRLLTDGDFWTNDLVNGAAFLASGYGVTKGIKYLAPGARITRGVKSLNGLKYGTKAEALSAEGLTGASEKAATSAGTAIAEGGEALVEGVAPGVAEAALGKIPETASPFYRRILGTLGKLNDPAVALDKGIATFINTANEAMIESIDLKNSLIDQLSATNKSDGTSYTPDEINKITGRLMTNVYGANLIALSLSNLWETNLFYGKGKLFSGRNVGEKLIKDGQGVFSEADITKRVFGEKALDYFKKAAEGIAIEGLWEENIQLAIQRMNKDVNNADESFFTKLGEYVGQAISQTADAFTGGDPEAAISIGLGGLLGAGMNVRSRFTEIKQIDQTVKRFNDNVNFVKTNITSFFKTNPDGTFILDSNGTPEYDKGKIVDYMSSMNKTLNTTDLYHSLANGGAPALHAVVENELLSRLVKGYADAGLIDNLLNKLDSQDKFSKEDLAFLGFSPTANINEVKAKIQDFKNKTISYKNIYDNIERNFNIKMSYDPQGNKARVMKDTLYYLSTRATFLTDLRDKYTQQKDLVATTPTPFDTDTDSIVNSLNDLLARSKAAKKRVDSLSLAQDNLLPSGKELPPSNRLPNQKRYSVFNVGEGATLYVPEKINDNEVNEVKQSVSSVDVEELEQAQAEFEAIEKEVKQFAEDNKEAIQNLRSGADGFYKYQNTAKEAIASSKGLNRQRSITEELNRAINATYNVFSRLSDINHGEEYYDKVYGKRIADLFQFYEGAKMGQVPNQRLLTYAQNVDNPDILKLPPPPVKPKEDNLKTSETKSSIQDLQNKRDAVLAQDQLSLEDEQKIKDLDKEIENLEKELESHLEDVATKVADNTSNIPADKKDLFAKILSQIASNAEKARKVADGYMINGDFYRRLSEMINNTIPENIRKELQPSIQAGETVDGIVKAYFSNGITEEFKNSISDKISNEAFEKLIKNLDKVKKQLEDKNIQIVATNVITWDPVKKIAGEIDILAVDRLGNFKVYEIEARKDKIWHKVLNKEGVGLRIADLTQNQLSGYRNLFANQYGVLPNEVGVLFPVTVNIEDLPTGSYISKASINQSINVVPKVNVRLNTFIARSLGRGIGFKGYNIYNIFANTFLPSSQDKQIKRISELLLGTDPTTMMKGFTLKVSEAQPEFQEAYNAQVAALNKPATGTYSISTGEVIPFTPESSINYDLSTESFSIQQELIYKKVTLVGNKDLISLIKIGSAESHNTKASVTKKSINEKEKLELENKFGIKAYQAYKSAVKATIDNRSKKVENIVPLQTTLASVANNPNFTKHKDAPNLYSLKGNKEIGLYHNVELVGYMSPVPALAYQKEDGSYAILDENADVDTYVNSTGNNIKSYEDFKNINIAYKGAIGTLIDRMNNSTNKRIELTNDELVNLFNLNVNYGMFDYIEKGDHRPFLEDLKIKGIKVGGDQIITVIHLDDKDNVSVTMNRDPKGKKLYAAYQKVDSWANQNVSDIRKALTNSFGKRNAEYAAIIETPDGTYRPIALQKVDNAVVEPKDPYTPSLGNKFTTAVSEKVFSNPTVQIVPKGFNAALNVTLDSSLFSDIYNQADIESLEKLGVDIQGDAIQTNDDRVEQFLGNVTEDQLAQLESLDLNTKEKLMDSYYNTEGFSNMEDYLKNLKECKLS